MSYLQIYHFLSLNKIYSEYKFTPAFPEDGRVHKVYKVHKVHKVHKVYGPLRGALFTAACAADNL